MRVYRIDDQDLPESLHPVRKVFSQPPAPRNDRKRGESLHNYYKRRNIPGCFCKDCRREREAANQERLV